MEASASKNDGTLELVAQVSDQIGTLVREELELARVEMSQSLKRSAVGLAMVGGSMGCGILAAASVHEGILGSLSRRISPLGAGILAATGYGVAAVMLSRRGIEELRRNPPLPRGTAESIRDDLRAVAHSTRSTNS